jgi:serine/threonine protein kinase
MITPASRKLGKYEIRRKLGRGGMADVYLAEDVELGSEVALKLIEYSADPEAAEVIEAERRGAQLQAHLAAIDARVARIYDSGDLDGYFFVAMEYIDGQDLAELLRRGPVMPEFAVDVALAVAETLEHAHTLSIAIDGKDCQGIIHGDIKPKNIRIDSRGQVRLLDFGIAKALSLSRRLTRNEFGSVPYASPERLDFGEVNALSDLWSLAVMLYEMVTGLQPYSADSTERLERMILSRIPPPPAPDPCPETLRRILRKAMAPDPAARYATARQFAADLRAFRNGEPVAISDEDLDATRRTFRKSVYSETTGRSLLGPSLPERAGSRADSDVTRRTSIPVPDGRGSQAAVMPARERTRARSRVGLFVYFLRALGLMVLFSFLYGAWAVTSEYFLWEHGQQLERQVETEQLTDPDQIWSRWTELSRSNPSSWLLYGPRKLVRQKFLDAADYVIGTYRNNSQSVYEKDWERARTMAARALAVNPDDAARYRLRLAEGHIARINGTAHNSIPELNLAVEKFTEAQRLMPRAPDPELGLARVYVYGLKDIDRAYQALEQAAKLGYPLGNREKLQLADGYLARGDSLWWDSRKVRGMPQEKEQIQRAADDYQRALKLYQEIAPYGNANSGILRVGVSLVAVEFRLHQLAPPSGNAGPSSGLPAGASQTPEGLPHKEH